MNGRLYNWQTIEKELLRTDILPEGGLCFVRTGWIVQYKHVNITYHGIM